MADAPLVQNVNALNALLGIPKTLFGDSKTVTTTESSGVSQAGIAALLKSLLEGTSGKQGLAAVAAGEKAPGLYNTTSKTLLVNDLLARSAAEAEKAGTGKTTAQKVEIPGLMSSKTGLLGAALLLGGTKKGRDLVSKAWDELGFGSNVDLGGSAISLNYPAGSYDLFGGFDMSSAAADFGGFGSSAADLIGGSAGNISDFFSTGDAAIGPLSSFSDFTGLGDAVTSVGNFASFADPGYIDTLGEWGDMSAAADAGSFTPGVGSILRLASGDIEGAAGSAAGAAIGSAILPGIGTAIGSVIGGNLCFITTAICATQGKPDDCDELEKLRAFRDTWLYANKPEDIAEYYRIAPRIVASISMRQDAAEIWNAMYSDYIVPAIEAIDSGEPEFAYITYRNMVETAKEYANGSN